MYAGTRYFKRIEYIFRLNLAMPKANGARVDDRFLFSVELVTVNTIWKSQLLNFLLRAVEQFVVCTLIIVERDHGIVAWVASHPTVGLRHHQISP